MSSPKYTSNACSNPIANEAPGEPRPAGTGRDGVVALRVLACAACVLVACASSSPASSAELPSPSVASSATTACRDRAQVEDWLARFAAAFNSGDEAKVRAVRSPDLWALSFTVLGHNDAAYGRESAVQDVLARQREGDRLELRQVTVNELAGWDGAAQVGPVRFGVRRGQAVYELAGKGAVCCAGPAAGLKVLGLGDR